MHNLKHFLRYKSPATGVFKDAPLITYFHCHFERLEEILKNKFRIDIKNKKNLKIK